MKVEVINRWPTIHVRAMTSFFGNRFEPIASILWKPGITLESLAPREYQFLPNSGMRVWAVVNSEVFPQERWKEEVSHCETDITISFHQAPAGVVEIALFIVATVVQIIVAKQLKPGRPPSPTYTFGPMRTQSAIGQAVPVIYGTHDFPGYVISRFVTIDESATPALNTLVCLSEGPIAALAGLATDSDGLKNNDIPIGIKINGTEARQIPGTEVSFRLGSKDQAPIPGFSDQVTGNVVNTVVAQNYPVTYRTAQQIETLEVLLNFIGGLYYQGKKLHAKSVPIVIKYQKLASQGGAIDPNGWTVGDHYTRLVYDPNTMTYVEEQVDGFIVRKKLTTPFTISKKYGPLDKGYYAIEVTRNWVDDAGHPGHVSTFHLDSVNEGTLEDSFSYPNRALIAVKNMATSNFNGAQADFQVNVQGKLIYVWTGGTVSNPTFTLLPSNNPAWVVLDMLTNVRYGGGERFSLSNVDLQSFKDWADWCDELIDISDGNGTLGKRFECNIVFDVQEPIWDQCMKVAAAARAALILSGRVVRIKIDRAESPVQIFSMGNILRDTFRFIDTGTKDKKNFIEAQFLNSANNYSQDTASLHDPDITQLYKRESVTLFGITKPYQAYRQAKYLLNVNRLVINAVEFEAPIDSIACEPGDKIVVQSDIVGGVGGRVLAATSNTVTLDREIPIVPGSSPRISVRTNASLATWSASTFSWNSAFGLTRSWVGVSGQDVIQSRNITQPASASAWFVSTFAWNSATGTSTRWAIIPAGTSFTVSSAWDVGDIPQKYDVYIYDQSSTATPVGRRYRVTEISRAKDFTAKIVAVEYNEAVYEDDPGTLDQKQGSASQDPGALPPSVTGLSVVEIVGVNPDGTVISSIQVSWIKPNHNLPYSNVVYIRPENIPDLDPVFAVVGETNQSSFTIPDTFYELGFTYSISVTSRSIGGTEGFPDTAPRIAITPTGTAARPDDVTGFSGTQVGDQVVLTWNAVSNPDLFGYEIRYGASWQSGSVIGTGISGTSFGTSVWVPGSNTYWIKAKNTTGGYSNNAAFTIVIAIATGTIVMDEEEASDWVGTKINFTINHPNLLTNTDSPTWTSSTYAWNSSQATVSVWQGVQATYEAVIYRPGSWAFHANDLWSAGTFTWNTGFLGDYLLQITKDIIAIDTQIAWSASNFTWQDNQSVVSDWLGVLLSDTLPFTVALKVAISTDGTSFGGFQNYTPGVYTFAALKVQLIISGASSQYRAKVRGLRSVASTT